MLLACLRRNVRADESEEGPLAEVYCLRCAVETWSREVQPSELQEEWDGMRWDGKGDFGLRRGRGWDE